MSFSLNIAHKRIMIDIKNFKTGELADHGIYCLFDDNDMFKAKACIIGPEGTPYERGFYLFDLEFPKQYPLYPPKVKFMTLNEKVRFNPNLYKSGKVCVSILGTWSGPGWTSCMTLNTVLLSLQSLLHSNPIQNEPGWETEIGEKSASYNEMLSYYNFNVAIIDMINNPTQGFEVFTDIMIEQLKKNSKHIYAKIKNFLHLDNKKVFSSIYSMGDILKYNETLERFMEICSNNNIELDKGPIYDNISLNSKPIRKAPNSPAKSYEVGFVIKSENDGNNYKVILQKNNIKKWVKV